MRIVPELARCIDSLLHVHVGATELLYLLLKSILHEMLSRLALTHHRSLAADWIQLLVLVIQGIRSNILQLLLYLRGLLALSLELVAELAALRRGKLWRALGPDASLDLVARLTMGIVVNAHEINVVLLRLSLPSIVDSVGASTIRQVVVHDQPPLPLLHAADCCRVLAIADAVEHEVVLLIWWQFLPLSLACQARRVHAHLQIVLDGS